MKGNNSMNTYSTVSGIGSEFCEVSPDGLIALVKQAPRYKEKSLANINLDSPLLAFKEIDAEESIRTVIGECLNEITGLNSFCGVVDDDGCEYIIFVDKAPWEYTEKEKGLTKDDVVNHLKTLLGDVVLDLEIGDIEIANYLNQ